MRSLTFIIVLIFSSVCFSQRWVPVSQASPKFQTYFAKFRSAAQRSDKVAVASLTAFPFERSYDSDAENFARAEFIKRYAEILGKAKVFAESDPTVFEFRSGYIALFDPEGSGENYLFKPVASGYSFYSMKPEVHIKFESTAPDFQVFYSKLRTAVSGRNTASVAALAQFPFNIMTSTYDPGSDTTKNETVDITHAEFLGEIKFAISDFPKAPEFIVYPDGRFSTLCDNYSDGDSCAIPHFFRKIDGSYKLTGFVTDTRNE